MTSNLRPLLARLRQTAPDLDAQGVAEAIWLAATLSAPPPDSADSRTAQPRRQLGDDAPTGPQSPVKKSDPRDSADRTQSETELRDFGGSAAGTEPGRRIGVRSATALPQALDLARSLRPFKRAWLTGRHQRLDIDATVRAYAETGRLMPVFRPAPERWYDVAVVVDDSPTMAIWHDTAAELATLLERLGAFRQVRTWRMAVSGGRLSLLDTLGRPASPRSLFTADDRRLVLVLTDGLSPHWDDPDVWQQLRTWAARMPTALVNPLSTRLWRHTGLDQPAVTATPATAVGRFEHSVPPLLQMLDDNWIAVPAVTVTPHSMGRWARSTMRSDPNGADALLVPSTGRLPFDPPAAGPDDVGDPAALLRSFLSIATPASARLAVLCSPYSQLTLPLLTLLRQELLPAAQVSDVAELVVAGLMTVVRDRDRVVLRMRDGVRELLQERLSENDAWLAYQTLTTYVAKHAGHHGGLAVAVPDPTGDLQIPAGVLPFAAASYEVLRLLHAAADSPTITRSDGGPGGSLGVDEVPVADPIPLSTIVLHCSPLDEVWADWIGYLFQISGYRVVTDPDGKMPNEDWPDRRDVVIVSAASTPSAEAVVDNRPLAIYVDDVTSLSWVTLLDSAYITWLSRDAAAQTVLTLVGSEPLSAELLDVGPRYPREPCEIFNVSPRNSRFIDREAELRRIRTDLKRGHLVAAVGMGGVGKTQTAMEYAHRFATSYDIVWWMNSATADDIEASLAALGSQLNVASSASAAETVHTVLHILSNGNSRCLLVFDNADEPSTVEPFLPVGPCHVLITSRNPQWADRATFIEIDVFPRTWSIELLRRQVPTISMAQASEIAETLADLPIAVAAAGAWLADTGRPVDEYLRLMRDRPTGSPHLSISPDLSIQRTWDLSLDMLQDRSPAAYRLFQLFSVMAPEISLDLVDSPHVARLLEPFDHRLAEPGFVGALVQEINRLALLRIFEPRLEENDAGSILIHRVVQSAVRARMSPAELDQVQDQAQLLLAAAQPRADVDDPATWPHLRAVWPHLDVVEAVESRHETVRELIIDRVRYQWLHGDLTAGRTRAEHAVTVWTDLLEGVADSTSRDALQLQLLRLQFNLANILADLGQFSDARVYDEHVLEMQTSLLGESHGQTLMTAGGLARDLRGLGRYHEALERDARTYDACADNFGPDHPRTLTALSNLATTNRLVGDFRTARVRDEEVLERRRLVLGERHPFTIASAASLARDIRDAGDYSDSVRSMRTVYNDCVVIAGPDARAALTAQVDLGVSLRRIGEVTESEQLLVEAYGRLADRLGLTNPETVRCSWSLALTRLEVEEYAAADEEMRAAEDFYQERLGDGHPVVAACRANRALVERAMGNIDIAVIMSADASHRLSDILGAGHPHALSALLNHAICEADVGRLLEARELLEQSRGLALSVLGADHPHALGYEVTRTLISAALGGPDTPPTLEALGQRLVARVGAGHPMVAAALRRRYLYQVIDLHPF